jgi:hypothetical protein
MALVYSYDELKKRGREIDRKAEAVPDEQELKERAEAVDAYFGEDEKHFSDYVQDCIKLSTKATENIRRAWDECYHAFQEDAPINYLDKESWQSRIIVPRPFQTVMYGSAAVKKAFNPDFLTVESPSNPKIRDFWQPILEWFMNGEHSDFLLKFTDADTMALAVGMSQEMIPRWSREKGLEYVLVEPWKIHRDPDALSRDPQSGMFWIHQEWLDYWLMKELEKTGKYFDVARAKNCEENPEDPFLTKDAIAARKDQIWNNNESQYRKMILNSEFYGTVLDKKGEMLHPLLKLTVAGGRVVEAPKPVPYTNLKWPGVAFSPMPDLLRFGGRGLLKGVLTMWEAMNSIMNLHMDNLLWVVNPMTEINVDALDDPSDTAVYPGKRYLVKDTASGQQVIRTVERQSRTNEVLANVQFFDNFFQGGSFVPANVQGLPGWRQEITARESAQNLNQSLSVYSLMGENIEKGAILAVKAGAEMIQRYITMRDIIAIHGMEKAEEFMKGFGIEADVDENGQPTGLLRNIPPFDADLHISGIQALMKDQEALLNLKTVIMPLAESPRFGKYIKPYEALKSLERRTSLEDEDVIVDQNERIVIDKQEAFEQAKQKDAVEAMQQLQQLMGIVDLAKAISEIKGDVQEQANKVKGLLAERNDSQSGSKKPSSDSGK